MDRVFGDALLTYSRGKEKMLKSYVRGDGYNISGKLGDINPLTGDIIIANSFGILSESTIQEIELWQITFID